MKPIVRNNAIYNWGNIETIETEGLTIRLSFNSGRYKKISFKDSDEMGSFINNLMKELKND